MNLNLNQGQVAEILGFELGAFQLWLSRHPLFPSVDGKCLEFVESDVREFWAAHQTQQKASEAAGWAAVSAAPTGQRAVAKVNALGEGHLVIE